MFYSAVQKELIGGIIEIQFALETMGNVQDAQSRLLDKIFRCVSSKIDVCQDDVEENFPLQSMDEITELETNLQADRTRMNGVVSCLMQVHVKEKHAEYEKSPP